MSRLVNPKKAITSNIIPPKILKMSSEASSGVLHNLFNDMLKKRKFS